MRTSDQSVIESETGDEPAYLAQTRKVRARQDETQPSHAAGPIRKVIWWIWLGGARVFRPLVFLTLVSSAVILALLSLVEISEATGWSPSFGRTQAHIARIFDEAIDEDEDALVIWRDRVESALRPDRLGRADLTLAESYLASLEDMVGIERLGLESLSRGENIAALEAELRSLPSWERTHRLNEAYEQRLAQAQAQGIAPAALIFIAEDQRQTYVRAKRLYGRLFREADLFVTHQGPSQIDLAQIPGLAPRLSPGMVLYGDVRDAHLHACAYLSAQGRAQAACARDETTPTLHPDVMIMGLSGLSLALESETLVSPQDDYANAVMGLSMVKVAWAAQRIGPDFEESLAVKLSDMASADQVADALSRDFLLTETFQDPHAYAGPLKAQIGILIQPQAAHDLAEALEPLQAVRRNVGGVMAIRLLESVNTLEALPQLATLVDHAGLRSLALYDIAGASMLRGVEPVHDIPQRAWHILMAALAALGAAVLIVLITVWPRNPLRTSIGERVNTFAAWLILGKKA